MDVHPPHEPIRTWKDFLLHLLTITIGLLIALGLEGIVEWRHHEHLVAEANATLREEVQHNSQMMNRHVVVLKTELRELEANLRALGKIQNAPGDKSVQTPSLTADFTNIGLRETAWRTAQSTGALSFMPYDEAQRYADIYQQQEAFLTTQQTIAEDQAASEGLVAKFNLSESKNIALEQANELAERYGRWRGHLLYLDVLARVDAANYEAFLNNKPAPTEMHEDVN